MSSLQEKKNLRSLIRQGSLDKIKCSVYPILGSFASKKSTLIHILEIAMNSSRALIQTPVIVVLIPTVQFFYVTMAIFMNLITKNSRGITFENLDKFLIELNHLKSQRRLNSIRQEIMSKNYEIDNDISSDLSTVQSNLTTTIDDHTEEEDVYYDCLESPTRVDEMKINVKKRDRLLKVASFIGITFTYIQLSILFYLIGVSTLKLGLLFMLFCVVIIFYIISKISFMKRSPTVRRSRKLKAVKQKIGKALTSRQITCVSSQIIRKFPEEKQKSL